MAAFDPATYPIEGDRQRLTEFNTVLQDFIAKKSAFFPVLSRYTDVNTRFLQQITAIQQSISGKINAIRERLAALDREKTGLQEDVARLTNQMGMANEDNATRQRLAELQQQLTAIEQERQQLLQAKNSLLGLLDNVREQMTDLNNQIDAAGRNGISQDALQAFSAQLAAFAQALRQIDTDLEQLANPQAPARRGGKGKRKTKRHQKKSKKTNKKKSKKTAKRVKKMRGGYSYGKSKRRRSRTSSTSSLPASLSSSSKNVILF